MAPTPPTPPTWIDEAMLEYLLNTGQGAGTPIGDYTLPPEDMDEYGTMDWQGDRLTQLNKGANLSSSLPFILGLGAGPGGAAPEAFNPIVSYQPVKVPGALQLERWKNDGDPIHSFVYTAINDLNWSEEQVRTYLLNVLTDPENEFHHEYISSVPPQLITDQVTGATTVTQNPDINYTLSQVANLYSTLAADDPWDGQTFDPTTNRPAVKIEEDSPLMAELKKAGYSNTPYDTYDPWAFAPEGMTPESLAQSQTAASDAQSAGRGAARDSRMQNTMLSAMMQGSFPLQPSADQIGPRPTAGQSAESIPMDGRDWAGQSNATKAWWEAQDAASSFMNSGPSVDAGEFVEDVFGAPGSIIADVANQFRGPGSQFGNIDVELRNPFAGVGFGMNTIGEGEEGGKISIPWFQRPRETTGRIGNLNPAKTGQTSPPVYRGSSPPPGRGTPIMDQLLQRGQEGQQMAAQRERFAAANRRNMEAYGNSVKANADAGRQAYDAAQRQKMVELLLSQGRGPFYDQQRGRQQQVWGI